jgi:hypothetical protein
VGLVAGGAGVFLSLAVALGAGAPVLDHDAHAGYLIGGLVGAAACGWVLSRGWPGAVRTVRWATSTVVALLTVCFALGVLTNPVVVDGRVFLATSPEAQQYRLMNQVYADLLRLRQIDVYLDYDAAEAGARHNEYPPIVAEIGAMSARYATYTLEDLPDPRFVDTITAMKSATYFAHKGLETKTALLNQPDSKLEADVEVYRADFAEQYLQAGRALNFLSADLNIPYTTLERE